MQGPCSRRRPCRRTGPAAALLLALIGLAPAAQAVETKQSGDWFDAATWTPSMPGGADAATIKAGHTVTVQQAGAGARFAFVYGSLELSSVGPPATLSVEALYASGAAGQVWLSKGARLTSGSVTLNGSAGGPGLVSIDGAATLDGSRASWANSLGFDVGVGDGVYNGTVLLTNDARIGSRDTTVGGSDGVGLVDIKHSSWVNSNSFVVGSAGLATLYLHDHALVSDVTGVIGAGSSYYLSRNALLGNAIVDNSSWTHTGDFIIGGYGKAQLSALNGALISSQNAYIGREASAIANATLDGASWSNGGAFFVGYNGDGTLLIKSAASLSSVALDIGASKLGKGLVTVDGTTLALSQGLVVGNGLAGLTGDLYDGHASGQLNIRNGARVSSAWGEIGKWFGASGTVEVKGADAGGLPASWITGPLYIGESGSGTLRIAGGGLVQSAKTYLGQGLAGGGALYLDGTAAARGVLETEQIVRANGSIVFDGGVLRASVNQPSFLLNVAGVVVQAGGAHLDSNGHNLGVNTTLSGAGGLHKLGQGTLDLQGLAFLASVSTVEAGRLLVNGSFTGDVEVQAGAILGGSGSIAGAVHVLAGGVLAPGNSPGTLAVHGTVSLDPLGALQIELGPQSDLLLVQGDLVLSGVINFSGDAAFFAAGSMPSFLAYSGSLDHQGLRIGSLPDGVDRNAFVLDFSKPGLVGVAAAVPEPASAAMLLGGLMLLLLPRARRRLPRGWAPAP